ncbi:MAG: hypothetical protein A3E51_00705 [Burkholderiales bacterium RIFCSPHIGHO2_12_FULL_67_38]|nr:MAG: hypothetical protein A3E51_00705 [Burkholderiales bacterium RIFCSPHIGHO2_12_FULL_67_38]
MLGANRRCLGKNVGLPDELKALPAMPLSQIQQNLLFFGSGLGKQAVAARHPAESLRGVQQIRRKKGVFWQ